MKLLIFGYLCSLYAETRSNRAPISPLTACPFRLRKSSNNGPATASQPKAYNSTIYSGIKEFRYTTRKSHHYLSTLTVWTAIFTRSTAHTSANMEIRRIHKL